MKNKNDLQRMLQAIDHRSYPAYKDLKGSYSFGKPAEGNRSGEKTAGGAQNSGSYVLSIDHVQGDPFASPSRISILIDGKTAGFPASAYDQPYKRIALQDYLTRLFHDACEKYNFKAKGSGKSGLLSVSRCGQEVLERTAVSLDPADGSLHIRMAVGFPANGRTINASELSRILFDFLPDCVQSVFYYRKLNPSAVESVIFLAEDQHAVREQLNGLGLVAFVANGSILPRESGVSDRPMKNGIPFSSPDTLKVELQVPHRGRISGMGIRKGITLIVGGGYHGKSTLLEALELGVYNHIAGDGREFVITDEAALKIRSEDGRSIKKTDISMFVNDLPNGKDTRAFSSEDASGSTSQAANVVEGLESGASLFLIDEDTCATNFMIRDELMQRVVLQKDEPITPFIERARYLYESCGISSCIVAGSSGSYFHIADCIIQMDRYHPKDITAFARKEAAAFSQAPVPAKPPVLPDYTLRRPGVNQALRKDDRLKIKSSRESILLGRETIDLRYLEQLADGEQTAALSYLLAYAEKNLFDGRLSLTDVVDRLCALAAGKGLASLSSSSYLPTDLVLPRRQEIFSCFNRYRGLKL